MTKDFAVFRCRQPRRRAARAVGEIPRTGVPPARQARALAPGGPDRRVSENQRRDLPRQGPPQSAAACAVATRHDLGCDRRTRPAHQAQNDRRCLGPAGSPRLADMDAMGVDQSLLYPTWFAEGFFLCAIRTWPMRWPALTTTGSLGRSVRRRAAERSASSRDWSRHRPAPHWFASGRPATI